MLVGGAAATLPMAARGQQQAMPVIGFLTSAVAGPQSVALLAAFHQGLKEQGYVEGQNVTIEYRWADGRYDRLPSLVAELVKRQVAVIASTGGDTSAHAAKAATTSIPIVFVTSNDPVTSGLVASLNRPGGNITGVYRLSSELLPKGLELLHEVVPNAAEVAFLVNQTNVAVESYIEVVEAAGRTLGRPIRVLKASTDDEIDTAFETLVKLRIGALQIGNDPFFSSRARRLAALTLRHAVPTIYSAPDFVQAGGLMSYGGSLADGYRLVGTYTGRILKGEKSSDLPVQQYTKIELVINLKTARTLGLTIPLPLLGLATEVVE